MIIFMEIILLIIIIFSLVARALKDYVSQLIYALSENSMV